ncbi:hypothetical protein CORC01_04377 [Colletotrichum orchidophilum]|uniref:DUF7598 domain-containing protein n=1 Tax=Colletotrichum orchidophilum TaxID=1209926 RepID=A0A1G4BGB5_9PEZI|nr:uncharacterized protein CORC01_04377 [Colletotrichum orchidophilum]OHF00396.1 hypothetical protein CORC01_04377 [Colletotrichum orchidophilum]
MDEKETFEPPRLGEELELINPLATPEIDEYQRTYALLEPRYSSSEHSNTPDCPIVFDKPRDFENSKAPRTLSSYNARMFNLSENSGLRGSGHLILNVFRAFNIIGLLAVSASTWTMIVMSILKGNFAFFDSASRFFTFSVAIFLIFSELNIFRAYFERNWPVLSPEHGLSWLGIAMVIMGCHVLAGISVPAFSVETIGLPLWRLILASGILVITFGFFNIVSSIVFRDGSNGINARNIRSEGTLASGKNSYADGYSVRSNSIRNEKPNNKFKRLTQRFTPWNKRNDDASPRLNISQPIARDVEQGHNLEQGHDSEPERDFDEDRRSPIMPDVARPATALHPAMAGHRHYSKYSLASNVSRF